MSIRCLQPKELSLRGRVPKRLSISRVCSFGQSLASTPFRIRKLTVSSKSITRNRRQVTQMGLFGLGLPELLVIAGVAALLFGPSKLPELGKGLGKTMKNVQVAAKEFETELKKEMESEEEELPVKKQDEEPSEEASTVTSSVEKES